MDDELLIQRAKNGDIDAFEQLIVSYEKRIYNIALKTIKNPHDAQDIAQDAIIKIYKSINGFKAQCTFSAWVYRVVVNTALDVIRQRKKRVVISLDKAIEDGMQHADTADTPETSALRSETSREIKNAIDSLEDDYRIALTLKDICDMSYIQISEVTKANIGTVKSRISRARSALKKKLEKNKELFKE